MNNSYAIMPNNNASNQEEEAPMATTHEVNSTSEDAGTQLVMAALGFLAKPATFAPEKDVEIRQMCSGLSGANFTHFSDVFKTLGALARKADDDETWKIVRKIFSKIVSACTRDLHFKVRGVERRQEEARKKGVDLTIGEIETYDYPGAPDDQYTVAEFYDGVEMVKTTVDQWNTAIVMILGWEEGENVNAGEFDIPYCWVLKQEAVGKTDTDENDYEPARSLGDAFLGLGRAQDAKTMKRKEAAASLLDSLLGSLAA